ncbi:MAG: transglycosylase SLT domain-containing protein [Acidobacteria bacterium]|nr:transglycosylase SLT domain-containing protein [Acidobacteriota bacterium]
MIFLLLLGFQNGSQDLIWEKNVSQVRAALETNDWYRGKQLLRTLEELNPERYHSELLDATMAWIAETEGHLDTAIGCLNTAFRHQPDPLLALELGQLLARQKRWQAVSDILRRFPESRYSGKMARQYLDLYSQAEWHLGARPLAFQKLKQLCRLRGPSSEVQEYRLRLAHWAFALNQKAYGQQTAWDLLERWPGSDEALDAVNLLESELGPTFFQSEKRTFTLAWVYYRNREFVRASRVFDQLIEAGPRHPDYAKAMYFRALSELKDENPDQALIHFQRLWPLLQNTDYAGQTAFQIARCLFMLKRDKEVVSFLDQYFELSGKWYFECERLRILALRRQGWLVDFEQMNRRNWPEWLNEFYDRNAVAWALERGEPALAAQALNRLAAHRLDYGDRLEIRLWQGIIEYLQGQYTHAGETWIALAKYDPNHFYGLVARQLLHESGLGKRIFAGLQLGQINLEDAQVGFLLAEDPFTRRQLGAYLQTFVPQWNMDLGYEALSPDSVAAKWARIGRYDLAAHWVQGGDGLSKEETLLLKAKWYKAGQVPFASIFNAEVLARRIPRWLPMELYPQALQDWLYPNGFQNLIQNYAQQKTVDQSLLLAIIREESRFNPQAKSVASARGLMQFIPATARTFGEQIAALNPFQIEALYQPRVSIELGANYVHHLLDQFDGVVLYSIAAYNAGEDAVNRWRSFDSGATMIGFVWDITYSETKEYCQKVLRSYFQYQRLNGVMNPPMPVSIPTIQGKGR